MKRILILLFLFIFVTFGVEYFVVIAGASAETISPGEIVKTENTSNIYYMASDEKLYVFPEVNNFFSWYDEFYDLRIVSDETFASYDLGGTVFYRPGKFLLKSLTSPKVYAVAPNGELRWIKDELTARKHYGPNWQSNVYDLNNIILTSHTIGDDITFESDYNRINDLDNYNNISKNQGLDNLVIKLESVDSFLAEEGEEPTDLRILPGHVGVFVELGKQQFKAEGFFQSSGKWEDITDQVDWRVADNSFSNQPFGADEVVWVEQDGMAVILNSWGRAYVTACYPKGCADHEVPAKFSDKTSLTIVTTSDWVNPVCMSDPRAKWYQVTESMYNVQDAGRAVTYSLYPGNTFFRGWGKLWIFYSDDGNRTFRSFAWDWTLLRTNNLKPTEEGYGQSSSWVGTMVSSICGQENCGLNPSACNGRRRSNIMFIHGGTDPEYNR